MARDVYTAPRSTLTQAALERAPPLFARSHMFNLTPMS